LHAKAGRAIIIFSASLPGVGLCLTERLFAYDLVGLQDFVCDLVIPVHSAPAHTYEMGGGLRGVVNDLL
jgi:hypothetical protein